MPDVAVMRSSLGRSVPFFASGSTVMSLGSAAAEPI